MLRFLCFLACTYFLFAAVAFADPVTLRARIEASSASLTIGDVFDGASPDVAGRTIAAAPAPGQVGSLSVDLLAAVASAAGLEWTPPSGVTSVRVVRPGGARATIAPRDGASVVNAGSGGGGANVGGETMIRRGQPVTLTYAEPGLAMTVRARALSDAALGESVRLVNISSEQTVEAVVTGPGTARANP
jgi:flagella basal body P-ring formation protein FlgA